MQRYLSCQAQYASYPFRCRGATSFAHMLTTRELVEANAAGSDFGAKLARQIPSNPGRQAKNDYVHADLSRDGIISNEDSDAEVDHRNRQPEPDEDPGTIYGLPIFALVDRPCDQDKR
jgi:hypothetical protein